MQRAITAPCEDDPDLIKTMELFNQACQEVINVGWEIKEHNKIKLHKLTYRAIRRDFPLLQSNLVQSARDVACDMLKRTKFTKKPKKHLLGSVRLNLRTFTPFLESGFVSVSTVRGRKKIPIKIPNHFNKYKDWRIKAATLKYKNSQLFFVLIAEKEAPKPKKPKLVLGVDLGVNNIAVCSNNTFFNSKHLKKVKGRYQYLRRKLQSIGTRSAKRKLKNISGRERLFVTDLNHCISKELVSLPFDCIAFEKLHIKKKKRNGKRFNKKLGGWSYAQLQAFTSYKAEETGKTVVFVGAAYTSQTCSKCSHKTKSNRNGAVFSCKSCGFELHSDLNASQNIASLGKTEVGRLLVNQPIVTS
ncbi:MAG: transposase [Candidatus Diapherotrites archaeon]|nr:transposase [Candidatus Diapherotrites archaeon]